jgi:hypothetical protein
LPTLDTLLTGLEPLARDLAQLAAPPPDLAELEGRFHFTVSERVLLRRLLLRRAALAPDLPLPTEGLEEGRRGGEVLHRLRRLLDDLAIRGPENPWPS